MKQRIKPHHLVVAAGAGVMHSLIYFSFLILLGVAKHLDGISDEDIGELNIPTGMPLHYVLGADMTPLEARHPLERALDPQAAAAAAAEVAAQAGGTAQATSTAQAAGEPPGPATG